MTNSAKRPSSKASKAPKTAKNTVGVQEVKGMIRLSLPREVSRAAYGVAQKFIFPGLPANDINLQAMKGKAAQISSDIATGNFDPSLEKYQLGVVAANKLVAIDGGKKPELTLLELWEKFKEYKRPSLAETTFKRDWEGKYTRYLTCAVNETDGSPVEIRNHLLSNHSSLLAKNTLASLEAMYQWGIQRGLVTKNLFLGMAKEIPIKKKERNKNESFDEHEDTRAFTLDERNAIIEYFENSSKISHWASFVKFLFWTGCRPGEAIALRWKHISPNCNIIRFSQSHDSILRITKSTKTDVPRIFPCNQKLQQLLVDIKPTQVNPESLVFPSKTGKQITWTNFSTVWRGSDAKRHKGVINNLIKEGKVRQYLKPYATRHTFITAQVNANVSAHTIAARCGNSADIIWRYYYQHKHDEPLADI